MKKFLLNLIKLKTIIITFLLLQSCFGNEYGNTGLDNFDVDLLHVVRDGTKTDTIKIDSTKIDTIK